MLNVALKPSVGIYLLGSDSRIQWQGSLNVLGEPAAKYREGDMLFNKPIEPWVKFQRKGHLLHVTFTGNGSAIRMVSLLAE